MVYNPYAAMDSNVNAVSVDTFAAVDTTKLRGKVVELLSMAYPDGLTCHQIEDKLQSKHETMSATLNHMEAVQDDGSPGLVIRTGLKRVYNKHRAAHVYFLNVNNAKSIITNKRKLEIKKIRWFVEFAEANGQPQYLDPGSGQLNIDMWRTCFLVCQAPPRDWLDVEKEHLRYLRDAIALHHQKVVLQ